MDKVYIPWPVAMEIADKLDENGFTKLAREARAAVWNEAARLYMRGVGSGELRRRDVKPLYIYLGPEPGYGAIQDRPPKLNQYHWYELGPALSDDRQDQHSSLLDGKLMEEQIFSHNPRRIREQ